jgi:putative two-component system response regulator
MAGNAGDPLILLVDDDEEVRKVLRRLLEAEGYRVDEAQDGAVALAKVAAQAPDLVILDVTMPHMDGNQVCARLKKDPATRLIPVIMHSGLDDMEQRLLAREEDADDYLVKGSSILELRARVKSLLRLKRYTDELENAAAVLGTVARIVEKRDRYVKDHCAEVAAICGMMGEKLGLPTKAIEQLRLGAAFHDIGKIVIEDAILQKPGGLDEAERARMMQHAAQGSELIEPMKTLSAVLPLIRHHHERLDGSGYPDGLKGEQISLEVRVLSVADIYQALVSERPYKPAFSAEKAVGILREDAARGWLDGAVVEVLAELVAEGKLK